VDFTGTTLQVDTFAATMTSHVPGADCIDMAPEQRRELLVFLFLTLVLAPLVAVVVVAGYGFCVWMYQLLAGPPGI
jgi:periplasmic nitrate reductase NapE